MNDVAREPAALDELAAASVRSAIESVLAAEDSALGGRDALDDAALYDGFVVHTMRDLVRRSARAAMLPVAALERGRLFDEATRPTALLGDRARDQLSEVLERELGAASAALGAHEIGRLYESLIRLGIERDSSGRRRLVRVGRRKRTGSFYTPTAVAQAVAKRSLEAVSSSVRGSRVAICDPAMGAGAFLLAAAEALVEAHGASRRALVETALHGIDSSASAVAVAEACLWLYAADPQLSIDRLRERLFVADSLAEGMDGALSGLRGGIDWLIGNPPWIAFAGRAAQPLAPEVRADYARRFASWRGYPSLHGLFIERATTLAPRGVIALLVPSPVADLDGYRATRRALTSSHAVVEPLLEFGQDAFDGVTQPCFALIAVPTAEPAVSDRRWQLAERQRSNATANAVVVPEVLHAIARAPRLPPECFREFGFQTSRRATTSLLLRAPEPDADHRYPLLEGRDVQPFRVGSPRLFIDSDPDRIKWAGCRLRPRADYERVRVVIRQTAKVPIAALHNGLPFRNSLLAGFDAEDIDAELLVGLLNSALYRALHLSQQRDARQAAFPQVKIAHLRGLPRPPENSVLRDQVRASCRFAAIDAPRSHAPLDAAVFDLFGVVESARRSVLDFVASRAPELGHGRDG